MLLLAQIRGHMQPSIWETCTALFVTVNWFSFVYNDITKLVDAKKLNVTISFNVALVTVGKLIELSWIFFNHT